MNQNNTRQQIIDVAKNIFAQKGYEGARMQEIADAAQINKGLLHYYFKSKSNLFNEVFMDILEVISPKLNDIFSADISIFKKIERFVNRYMDLLLEYGHLMSHVICEINRDASQFTTILKNKTNKPNPLPLLLQIQAENEKGSIKVDNPFQLMISIISLCVFPFVGKPMMTVILKIKNDAFNELMMQRKKWIIDFIINSIKA